MEIIRLRERALQKSEGEFVKAMPALSSMIWSHLDAVCTAVKEAMKDDA